MAVVGYGGREGTLSIIRLSGMTGSRLGRAIKSVYRLLRETARGENQGGRRRFYIHMKRCDPKKRKRRLIRSQLYVKTEQDPAACNVRDGDKGDNARWQARSGYFGNAR
ncbi:hypothetical protein IMZ48_36285 [Candidatus Bathyarchaeota archaeon]|nr:hypothetical protein [Candidatus Bathyarchaeota archaeon]